VGYKKIGFGLQLRLHGFEFGFVSVYLNRTKGIRLMCVDSICICQCWGCQLDKTDSNPRGDQGSSK